MDFFGESRNSEYAVEEQESRCIRQGKNSPQLERSLRQCFGTSKEFCTLIFSIIVDKVCISTKPKFLIRNAILLRDNARPRTTNLSREKFIAIHWTALQYSPYGPDLSSCDYHMFGSLKEARRGELFDDAAVEDFVRNWLKTFLGLLMCMALKNFQFVAKKCLTKSGDYVAK